LSLALVHQKLDAPYLFHRNTLLIQFTELLGSILDLQCLAFFRL
jgi:hypothetical protein